MRYVGQNFELRVPVEVTRPALALPPTDVLHQTFLREHELNYGFSNPTDAAEIIALRLTARGVLPLPPAARSSDWATRHPRPVATRDVWFNAGEPHSTPVFKRDAMAAGCAVTGPAVIEQFDATTLVFPGDVARVDEALNIIIELNS
jgi:N-methylhydantoinase A